MKITRRGLVKRLVAYPAVVLILIAILWAVSIRMPGASHEGPLPPLTNEQRESSRHLRAHVDMLAGQIGERNFGRMRALDSAANYVNATLTSLGYPVEEQRYTAKGQTYRNVSATLPPRPGSAQANEIVIVGGHYDSVGGSPGADDNASGMAGVMELARLLRDQRPDRTIRFVTFVNEEPPFFFTEEMGSRQYARAARARGDRIVAMLSIETIGYYLDQPGSQEYPPILGSFYPDRGNFVGIVGNVSSRGLVRRVVREFREHTAFPSAGTAAPMQIPGISWSDQWSFWKEGYDGVMITDTAPFRNKSYHQPWDEPDSLNYDHMARVVQGVSRVVLRLASASSASR